MADARKFWLLTNTASGSYSEQAVDDVADAIRAAGFDLDRMICFPDADDLPTRDELDAAGVDVLAVFTGDGTVNSCVTQLYGWGGAVLILPGGTMNLLSHRLHGDAEADEIIKRIATGNGRKQRRHVVRSFHGDALVGFSSGPATTWYDVREAMRDVDMHAVVDTAGEALHETMQEPYVRLSKPELGRREGYPLIEVVPDEKGLRVVAYNAQTLGDYLKQGWAMLLRRFRDGPHEVLGYPEQMVLENTGGNPLKLSIDGEPTDGFPQEELSLARTEVDLLATA